MKSERIIILMVQETPEIGILSGVSPAAVIHVIVYFQSKRENQPKSRLQPPRRLHQSPSPLSREASAMPQLSREQGA